MALLASVCGNAPAFAGEQPQVGIDLGFNIETVQSSAHAGLPLGPLVPASGLSAPLSDNLDFRNNYTNDARITFRPDDSDWVFSASIRYGRSSGKAKIHQALAPIPTTSFVFYKFTYSLYPSSNTTSVAKVPVTKAQLNGATVKTESHLVIDFEAGKDVGSACSAMAAPPP